MKSDLATKLKNLLDNMSQEQFDASWAEITALNLKGPTLDEYFLQYANFGFENSTYQFARQEINTNVAGDNNFALAA